MNICQYDYTIKKEKYGKYVKKYLEKHKSKHGLRTFESWIKKNKYKRKGLSKYSLFACDFETTYHNEFTDADILIENRATNTDEVSESFEPHRYSQVFLSGIRNIRTGKFDLAYENIPDTFDIIARETIKERHKLAIMYYHNLAYDGSYIVKWLTSHNYKQHLPVKRNDPLKPKHFEMLCSGGKFFTLKFKWKGVFITILDSLKLLPSSLSSLGETIGYHKLKEIIDYTKFEIDPNHNYPKDWITYLERDCEILAEMLKTFMSKEPAAESISKTTIGSVSYDHIKKIVDIYKGHCSISTFNYWNQWYNGGLTMGNVNLIGKWVYKPNLIKMVDACSMYPSQMIKPLPCHDATDHIDPNWQNYTIYYTIHIKKASIKPQFQDIAILPKPYIFVNNKRKIRVIYDEFGNEINTPRQYLQEVYDATYHFIKDEWELIKHIYNVDYEIIKEEYFELQPYLKEVVSEMFIEKQTAKDPTTKLIAKLKLNNLYGKLGQKPNRPQDFIGSKIDIPDCYEILGEKNTDYEAYNVQLKKELDAKAQPVHIASYITSQARCSLINKYLEIKSKGGTFLYCDTDSICYIDNPKKTITFDDIGNELGCWEFETDKETKQPLAGDGFISLCPKQYRIVKKGKPTPLKHACAGVKKELMSYVKNQDYNYDLGENELYNICKTTLKNGKFGKVIDTNSPFSFKKWKKLIRRPTCPKELKN